MFEKEAKELLRELYVIVKVGCSPFFKDEHKTFLTEIKEFLKGESMLELKTEEALNICKKCREKQRERQPQSINCAFLHDNDFCDRIKDIDVLISMLFKEKE